MKRGRVIWCLLVLLTVMQSLPLQAAEEDMSVPFDIPAQPLASALQAFAEQAHVQMLYKADTVEGVQSRPLSGLWTPEQGLRQMLQDTGLSFQFSGPNTITVVKPVGPQTGLATAGAQDLAQAQKPVKLPEVLVKDVRERDDEKTYVAEEASTATRTDTPIKDVPQSIQVITRKVIEEQRAFRLADALENIAGVNKVSSTLAVFDSFIIRGFNATNRNFFRNGLFDPTAGQLGSDTYNIQRLEVLKGPAAVLYGQGDPGGIINLVTKKGLPDPYYAGNVTLGNYDFYRSTIDATGPLNTGKTLMYRLNVAGQKADSFVDFVKRDMAAVSSAITWFAGPRTTLTIEGDYLNRMMRPYFGVPAQGSVLPNINGEIPRSLYIGIPGLDRQNRRSYRVGYDLTHQFNSNWSLRNAYRYAIQEADNTQAFPLALLADQRTLTRRVGGLTDSIQRDHHHSMITNLVGHFALLEMEHTLLTGVELRQDKENPSFRRPFNTTPLDIFAPDYSTPTGPFPINPLFSKSDNKTAALYVQDQITILPNLKFLGGLRFDYLHQSLVTSGLTAGAPLQTSDDTGVSPRLGLVYQPIEPVSLYTSWTRGFSPNSPETLNPNGTLFEPERSTQYEVGMKTFLFDNRIAATLAWYHLTRENLITPDPIDPQFSVQTGEQRSQGVELDVTANLTTGWNLIASYAYTDAEVTKDNNVALLGKRLGNVPYNKATLWSTYHFQEGPLRGFGIGGGVFGYTSRNASIFGPGQVEIPGYVRVDAALYYDKVLGAANVLGVKAVHAALNIRNLLDQRYIELAGNSTTRFFFGEPRTVLATVGLEF